MRGLDFADDEHDVRLEVVVEQVPAAGFQVRLTGQRITVHSGQQADERRRRVTQSKDSGRHPPPLTRNTTRLIVQRHWISAWISGRRRLFDRTGDWKQVR